MSDEKDQVPPKPSQPEPGDQPDPADPADRLAKLEAELAKATEQHLRLRAEFANYQKRAERDRGLAAQTIRRDFVKALLPALDALHLAVKHAGAEGGPLLDGVRAARDAFEKALAHQGAERIANTGTWDPDLHHPQAAIEHAEVPDGTILEEVRPGYKVGNLVARHSEVVVSKRPAEKVKEEKPEVPAEDQEPEQK